MIRRLLLRHWIRQRHEASLERIRKLEQWHRIHDEWVYTYHADRSEAVEMAKQGVTFVSHLLKQYYLPPVLEQLNERSILLG